MANILVLSYDLVGRTLSDGEFVKQKMARDGYGSDDSVLTVCWSRKKGSVQVSRNIRIEALRARLPKLRPLYDLLFIFIAPRVVRKNGFRPDTIVIADFSLAWAALAVRRACGGAIELHLNNLPSELAKTRGIFHRLYALVNEKCAWRRPDRFVVINDTTERYLLALGVPEQKIVVRAPDTIARDASYIAEAKPGKVRALYGIAEDEKIILSAGRLEKEKGFDKLLELFALSKLPARLIIVGDGALRTELEQQVRKLGIEKKVIFAGWQGRDRIWNYFADADAFVLLSRSEALGLVFWEAMYLHVPVIGRPVGGIKETIGKDGERGFLWDTGGGAEAFKRKLERAIARGPEVQQMTERARSYVDERLVHHE